MVGVLLAGDDPHQRRLAFAITAEQADAFAALDREIDAIEQCRSAEAQADVLECKQGHAWKARKRAAILATLRRSALCPWARRRCSSLITHRVFSPCLASKTGASNRWTGNTAPRRTPQTL